MRGWILLLLVGAAVLATWRVFAEWESEPPKGPATSAAALPPDAPTLRAGATPPSGEAVDVAPVPVSVAPWLLQLDAEEPLERRKAAYALREAIDAGTVPLEELPRLAAAGIEMHEVSARAVRRIEHLHLAAAALLPTLFDWVDPGGREGPNAGLAGRLIHSITCGKKHRERAREFLRPFLQRASAVILDEEADLFLRVQLLHIPEVMGNEAADLAPSLVEWIRGIEKSRAELEAANPGAHYSYMHIEFDMMRVLSALGPRALPAIVEGLARDDTHGEFELRRAIEEMPAEALPELEALVSHEDPGVVSAVLVAIARHRQGDAEYLRALRTLAGHPDEALRVVAITRLGGAGAAAAPELVAALDDESKDVRKAALEAIERVPAAAQAAAPRLLEMMRADPSAVSALTLGRLGPAAAEAAPAVLDEIVKLLANQYMREQILRDEDYAVRDQVFALEAFGPAATAMLVEAALGDPAPRAEAAIFALHRMSTVEAGTVKALAGTLGDLEGVSLVAAAGLLFDAGDEHVLQIVIEGLGSADGAVRATAAKAVERAGLRASEAWPALLGAVLTHSGAWRDVESADERASAQCEVKARERALDVVAKHDLEACLVLLLEGDADAAQQGARVVAAARERGLKATRKAWGTFTAMGRVKLVEAFGTQANLPKNALVGARPWIAGQLQAEEPAVRLAAVRAVRGEEHTTRVMETLIGLLRHAETTRDAAYYLRQAAGRDLLPYEAQLRAVPLPDDPRARSRLQAVLARIEAARPPAGP